MPARSLNPKEPTDANTPSLPDPSPFRTSRATRTRRVSLERLEGRELLSGVSVTIADATIKEQGNLTTFVHGDTNHLVHAADLAFGPDRNGDTIDDLYVVGRITNNVVVYDGKTGAFVEEFAGPSSGINGAAWMQFGPDGVSMSKCRIGDRSARHRPADRPVEGRGHLRVEEQPRRQRRTDQRQRDDVRPRRPLLRRRRSTDQVLRYDGITGTFIDAFVPPDSGGLDGPGGVRLRPRSEQRRGERSVRE